MIPLNNGDVTPTVRRVFASTVAWSRFLSFLFSSARALFLSFLLSRSLGWKRCNDHRVHVRTLALFISENVNEHVLDYRKKRASCSFENHYAHDCTTMLYYDRPLTHRASPSSYLVMAAFRNAVRHEDTPRVLPALLPFAFLFLLPARPFSISFALLLLFLSPSLLLLPRLVCWSFFLFLPLSRSFTHILRFPSLFYARTNSSTAGRCREPRTVRCFCSQREIPSLPLLWRDDTVSPLRNASLLRMPSRDLPLSFFNAHAYLTNFSVVRLSFLRILTVFSFPYSYSISLLPISLLSLLTLKLWGHALRGFGQFRTKSNKIVTQFFPPLLRCSEACAVIRGNSGCSGAVTMVTNGWAHGGFCRRSEKREIYLSNEAARFIRKSINLPNYYRPSISLLITLNRIVKKPCQE